MNWKRIAARIVINLVKRWLERRKKAKEKRDSPERERND